MESVTSEDLLKKARSFFADPYPKNDEDNAIQVLTSEGGPFLMSRRAFRSIVAEIRVKFAQNQCFLGVGLIDDFDNAAAKIADAVDPVPRRSILDFFHRIRVLLKVINESV